MGTKITTIRLPKILTEKVDKEAKENLRSRNKQIEFILKNYYSQKDGSASNREAKE